MTGDPVSFPSAPPSRQGRMFRGFRRSYFFSAAFFGAAFFGAAFFAAFLAVFLPAPLRLSAATSFFAPALAAASFFFAVPTAFFAAVVAFFAVFFADFTALPARLAALPPTFFA